MSPIALDRSIAVFYPDKQILGFGGPDQLDRVGAILGDGLDVSSGFTNVPLGDQHLSLDRLPDRTVPPLLSSVAVAQGLVGPLIFKSSS